MPHSTYRGNIVADARVRAYTETCTQPIWLPAETFQNKLAFPKTYTHKAREKTKESNNIMEA